MALFTVRGQAGRAAPQPWFALQCTQREKPDKKPLKDINVEMSSTSARPVTAPPINAQKGWKCAGEKKKYPDGPTTNNIHNIVFSSFQCLGESKAGTSSR